MLASAAIILMVAGIGNAYAYSYTNVEWSSWNGYNSVSYPYGHTYGYPTTYGGMLTWQNTFVNNVANSRIIPVLSSSTDDTSHTSYQEGAVRQYHDSWGPDGGNMPATTIGDHPLTITHGYLYEPSWWTKIFGRGAGSGQTTVHYYYA